MSIKIITDSSCDLGINFIEENNIELINWMFEELQKMF